MRELRSGGLPAAVAALGLAVLLGTSIVSARAGTTSSCTTSTYAAAGLPLSIPDPGTVDSSLSVPNGGEVEHIAVGLSITHPFDSDLQLQLVSPAGTTVELARGVGMWGHDFTNTLFDDQAAASIVSNLPPFTGSFRPVEPLAKLQGSTQGGTWKLRVSDERAGYSGQLTAWKLDITSCPSVSAPPPATAGAPTPPPLPTGVPSGSLPVQGTPVTVTDASDIVDGDTSSVANLLANPGADGTISLREAILATNSSPGTYTIRFAPALAGQTIALVQGELPSLSAGHILIDGDTNGDGRPDVTIANGSGAFSGLTLASSDNRVHALGLTGFSVGILLTDSSSSPTSAYAGNVIDGNVITSVEQDGISLFRTGPCATTPCESGTSWTDTRFIGNLIQTQRSGIEAQLQGTASDSILRTSVVGNTIAFSDGGFGLNLSAGGGAAADDNRISHALVAYNSIEGQGFGHGINAESGLQGGSANVVEDLDIVGNRVGFGSAPAADPSRDPSQAVLVTMSDGCSGGPGVGCSHDNIARRIAIDGNSLAGQVEGVLATNPCCGTATGSTLTDVNVDGNVIQGVVPPTYLNPWGVVVSTGGAAVSHVSIASNTIEQQTLQPAIAHAADLASGGIAIIGGLGKEKGSVTGVSASGNLVNTDLPGVTIVEGGPSDETSAQDALDNNVSAIDLSGNVIGRVPSLARDWDPEAKGISVIGGLGGTPPASGNWRASTGNSVTSISLAGNLVAGVKDDVSVHSDFGAGAADNTAALGVRRPVLTVAKGGSGRGSVTSDPPGIDCGPTCSSPFDDRTQVTLAATARAGSTFAGWSGACMGTSTCVLAMNGDQSATATFHWVCSVPRVKGKTLSSARRAIRSRHCSSGRVRYRYSRSVKKGRVISQSPAAGAHRPQGSPVNLRVSKGRKHRR